MVLKRIGYYKFDNDDIIGKCASCKGDIYNVPEYISRIPLNTGQLTSFMLGDLYIGLCPKCMKFYTMQGDIISALN
jgi:hypothetical protein